MELMDHTHSTVLFYFEYGDYLCNVVFLSLSLVFRQGPHLRMMLFSLRFSPLLLVVDLDDPICGPHPLFREAFNGILNMGSYLIERVIRKRLQSGKHWHLHKKL